VLKLARRVGLVASVFLSVGSGIAQERQLVDRVVAIVGGTLITLSDVRAADAFGLVEVNDVNDGSDRTTLVARALIDRELMRLEVDRFSALDFDASEIDRRMQFIRGRFPSEESFAAALADVAMTEERLRAFIRDDLRIAAYIRERFGAARAVTDEQVLAYYNDHQNEFAVDGRTPPFAEVEQAVRDRIAAANRAQLVNDWLDGLRRRTEVRVPGSPPG
jgi:hypothetical protein